MGARERVTSLAILAGAKRLAMLSTYAESTNVVQRWKDRLENGIGES